MAEDKFYSKFQKKSSDKTEKTENVKSVEKADELKETAEIQRIYTSLETDSYFCVENYYSLKEILLYDKKEFKN